MTTALASSGARRPQHGTVGAAFRNRDFRTIWLGMFASNVGTWMQNLALPAYVDERTHSASWVAVFAFAQLGPLLLLSIPGGVLADRFRPRPWMILMQSEQLVLSVVIAALVAGRSSLGALLIVQVFIGIGNALNAPAMQGTVPNLVPREDLPGAISLNSVMINGSRVLGPALAALLLSWGVTTSQIFLVNAATYLFVIYALARISLPPHHRHDGDASAGAVEPVAEVRAHLPVRVDVRQGRPAEGDRGRQGAPGHPAPQERVLAHQRESQY